MSNVGGMFAVMTFVHFVADWVPQPESWALVKHKDALIRGLHSFIYSALMCIAFAAYTMNPTFSLLLFPVFFFSHVFEDTYKLPMWWLKNIRRAKNIGWKYSATTDDARSIALNTILLVTFDQLVHLFFVLIACVLCCAML